MATSSTSSKVHPLSAQAVSYDDATHELVVTHADFAAATDNIHTVDFGTALPVNAVGAESTLHALSFEVTTPFVFSDASILSLLLEVGDSADPNEYMASIQIADVHASNIVRSTTSIGLLPVTNAGLTCLFTGTGSKVLSTMTAGEIRVRLAIVNASTSVNAG